MKNLVWLLLASIVWCPYLEADDPLQPSERSGGKRIGSDWPPVVTWNRKDDGYRGIWYMNQPSGDEYVYKYSGGLGTYCAKHKLFAVYCEHRVCRLSESAAHGDLVGKIETVELCLSQIKL